MLTVRWGTSELETALIIIAPCLMIPPCSYSLPTMYPVVFCRKISGVSVWLASRMNSVAFFDSSLNRTPRVLARMPTGKPWIDAQPVAMPAPQRCLYSEKREPSTIRR